METREVTVVRAMAVAAVDMEAVVAATAAVVVVVTEVVAAATAVVVMVVVAAATVVVVAEDRLVLSRSSEVSGKKGIITQHVFMWNMFQLLKTTCTCLLGMVGLH